MFKLKNFFSLFLSIILFVSFPVFPVNADSGIDGEFLDPESVNLQTKVYGLLPIANGGTGSNVLNTTIITEGDNLFWTGSRFDTAFGLKTTDNLTQGLTNKYYATSLFNTDFATKTTDNLTVGSANKYYLTSLFNTDFATKSTADLAELTNLYFTNERVDDRVSSLIVNGTGISWTYDDNLNALTPAISLSPFTTSNLTDFTDKRYVTDADLVKLSNTTGVNSGDQTNIPGNAETVTTNANLNGPITSVGNTTSIASQTGTGSKFVVDNGPTLINPVLGDATATSVTVSTGSASIPVTASQSQSTAFTLQTVTLPETSNVANFNNTNDSANYSSILLKSRTTNPAKLGIYNEWMSNNTSRLIFKLSNGASTYKNAFKIEGDTGNAEFFNAVTLFQNFNMADGDVQTVRIGKANSTNNTLGIEYKQDSTASKTSFHYWGDSWGQGLVLKKAGLVGIYTADPQTRLHITEPTVGNEIMRIESTATNDDPIEKLYQNRLATTDGNQTTLHTFTVPSSTSYLISAKVVARRTGGVSGVAEDGAAYDLFALYKNVAGTATLIGTVTNTAKESNAAYDATFTVSGATVRLSVTGIATTNITWHMTARVNQVSS
jgi:hypothetical protein